MPGPRSGCTGSAGSASTRPTAAARMTRYIRLGSGLDAQDAAPIRGIARGAAGAKSLDVTVAVQSAQQ